MMDLERDHWHKLDGDLLGKKYQQTLKLVGKGRRGWGWDVCIILNAY